MDHQWWSLKLGLRIHWGLKQNFWFIQFEIYSLRIYLVWNLFGLEFWSIFVHSIILISILWFIVWVWPSIKGGRTICGLIFAVVLLSYAINLLLTCALDFCYWLRLLTPAIDFSHLRPIASIKVALHLLHFLVLHDVQYTFRKWLLQST